MESLRWLQEQLSQHHRLAPPQPQMKYKLHVVAAALYETNKLDASALAMTDFSSTPPLYYPLRFRLH